MILAEVGLEDLIAIAVCVVVLALYWLTNCRAKGLAWLLRYLSVCANTPVIRRTALLAKGEAILHNLVCGSEVGGVVSWYTDVEGFMVGLSVCGFD